MKRMNANSFLLKLTKTIMQVSIWKWFELEHLHICSVTVCMKQLCIIILASTSASLGILWLTDIHPEFATEGCWLILNSKPDNNNLWCCFWADALWDIKMYRTYNSRIVWHVDVVSVEWKLISHYFVKCHVSPGNTGCWY